MEIEEKIKAVRNRDKSYRYKFFVFYDTLKDALQTGYRPCKICMKEEYHDYKNNNMETIKITRYQSPVGDMIVGSYGDKLCICDWAVEKRRYTIDRRIQRHLNAKYEEGTSEIIRLKNSMHILLAIAKYLIFRLFLPGRNFNVLYGES